MRVTLKDGFHHRDAPASGSGMLDFITCCRGRVLAGEELSAEDALRLIETRGADLFDLLAAANRVRVHFLGSRVGLCAVVNAKSGRCAEDCAFCSQSARHSTDAPEYHLMDAGEILEAARKAARAGAHSIGIVTSGRSLTPGEFGVILGAVRAIRAEGRIIPDVSIGVIDSDEAARLKEAGCGMYHHNLETARSFYGAVCTTRDYETNTASVRTARKAGLAVCSGGIFGLGETPAQRVELLVELRDLGVDRVPLNFLVPIEGTALAERDRMAPLDALAAVAVARMLMGRADIRICGGREAVLGELQGLVFFAGASGTMLGNYLTTRGRDAADDLMLLRKLELEW